MAGKAIMKRWLQLRSRAGVETDAWTDGGWRVEGTSPRAPTPLDTIQSEQSSVAVSTFSSASKCQAKFTHTGTYTALSDCLNADKENPS